MKIFIEKSKSKMKNKMNMKDLTIFLIMIMSLVSCQINQEKQGFTLTGRVENQKDIKVLLQDRVDGNMITLDSTQITGDNFVIENSVESPVMLYLSFENIPGRIPVFIENSEITVSVNLKDIYNYSITGSASHDTYEESLQVMQPYNDQLRDIQENMISAEMEGDEEKIALLSERAQKIQEEQKKVIKDYLKKINEQPVSVFIAMRTLAHGLDYTEMKELYDFFDPSLKGTRYYDEMGERVDKLEKVAIGNTAIDFSAETPEGELMSLSDFEGQFVLVNFWASWCSYCRKENPNLVKVYDKMKSDQFEILSVSLDRDKDAWLKGIEEDNLTWPQISDLKGWNSEPADLYVIRSIPQNVLVAPDGTIVARNLDHIELEKKINELLANVS